VSLLIRNNLLSHEVVCGFKSSSFEYICRLLPSPEPALLIGIYRPPNTNEIQFLNELDELLHLLSVAHVGVKMVLAGDFNINLCEYSGNSARFMDLAMSYSLFPSIFTPTRPASKTLLDNIFISWPGLLPSRVLTVDISDHLPVLAIIKDSVHPKSKSGAKIELARSFTASSIAKYQTCLALVNWETVYTERDPTIAYKMFLSFVQNAFHLCFPQTIVKNAKNVPRTPWMTPGLCKCVQKRSAMYKKYMKGKLPKVEYVAYRNILTRTLRNAKERYFNDFFVRNSNNAKAAWGAINNLSPKSQEPSPNVEPEIMNKFFAID